MCPNGCTMGYKGKWNKWRYPKLKKIFPYGVSQISPLKPNAHTSNNLNLGLQSQRNIRITSFIKIIYYLSITYLTKS